MSVRATGRQPFRPAHGPQSGPPIPSAWSLFKAALNRWLVPVPDPQPWAEHATGQLNDDAVNVGRAICEIGSFSRGLYEIEAILSAQSGGGTATVRIERTNSADQRYTTREQVVTRVPTQAQGPVTVSFGRIIMHDNDKVRVVLHETTGLNQPIYANLLARLIVDRTPYGA